MKKILLSCVLATLTSGAWAEKITSTIESRDVGKSGEDHLLKLSNGRVVFVEADDESLVSKRDMMPGSLVEIDISRKNYLRSIYSLPRQDMPEMDAPRMSQKLLEEPTVIETPEQAQTIFSGMNRSYYLNTECTDRAHIWTYEEWKKRGLISRKVFMFFTNTYIRRYNYHWWFHVSPYNLVKNGEAIEEKAMDRRYTTGPRSFKAWSDVFIRSKKACPVTTYRHYRLNKNGPEHCFHVKSDMYYRLPLHVRGLEDSGIVKTKFSTSEVNFSYRAFRRRGVRR